MPLATINGDRPNLRMVNAYFKDGSFFVATHGSYNKMKEIAKNPHVALVHNMFVAYGIGKNIGHPLDQENKSLREELRQVFSTFYEGHVHEDDKDTCFLKITLTDAVVYANDYRYSINFENNWAKKEKFILLP
jgi:general stress protein 26